MSKEKKALIIGSGVAGMAAAVRLAVQGYEVDVFESADSPGGKISSFEKDGFSFDWGPSLFTQPANIEELFAFADEPLEEYFSYSKLDVSCRYFFENGKIITAFADQEKLAAEFEKEVSESPMALKNYLRSSANLYKKTASIFLDHSLHKPSTWLNKNIFPALGAMKSSYLFSSLHNYNTQKFHSEEAAQVFDRFATYNGSNAFRAPAMLSVIPHLEFNEGVFYPSGGMISISNALYRLALKKNVRFHFNSPVQKIIHHEGNVCGIVVHNENILAPVVISNADVYHTYQYLLGHEPRAGKILRHERSSSALIFYWGMKKSFPVLGLHNIFFSKDYKEEFDAIFSQGKISNDPTVYVNITSKMEPGHAPSGNENWFVMINAPANKGQDWEAIKSATRIHVLKKLTKLLGVDVEAFVATEVVTDPISIEHKTGSFMGSLYGSSSNSKFSAFLRSPNFSGYIRGLYFCGGSVHPGGGIPLCFKSAKIVAGLIEKDFTKHH